MFLLHQSLLELIVLCPPLAAIYYGVTSYAASSSVGLGVGVCVVGGIDVLDTL
jgi:hypothetical protein